MTTNTASQAAASSNTGARKEWPQRFGTLTKLEVKSGRKGEYGILTVDCSGKFEQTAFIFNETALAKAKEAASKAHAAGVQANIWFKGPIESVDRGGFSEEHMKVVYFKDNTEYDDEAEGEDAPEAEGEDAPVSEDTAAEQARKDLDNEIPF